MSRRGRPAWEPTDKDRRQVQAMSAYGIPETEIAVALGVTPPTLRKYCREELDTGATRANARVAEFLYTGILGSANQEPFGEEKSRVTAAIFWLKTRAHWKETSVHQHQDLPPDEDAARKALNDKLAKLAFRRSKKPDTEPTD
jgi:hypothetical protein